MGKGAKRETPRRGGRRDGRGRFGSDRGHGGQINFKISNNQNKKQELKFYPHGTGPDQYTTTFNKALEHTILNIKSEFVNGSDISESIRKGVILDLSK